MIKFPAEKTASTTPTFDDIPDGENAADVYTRETMPFLL